MPSSSTTGRGPRVHLRTIPTLPGRRPRALAEELALAERLVSFAGVRRSPWLGRLRRALADGLFVLHFQPILSLRDGRVSHHEALLRLADGPDGALTAPAAFLPTAERSGLIREIDRMVIDRVLALLGGRAAMAGGVTVNVSAVSLTAPGMLTHLRRGLTRHDVDPARLMVEVTETAAIADMAGARVFCQGVLDLGCGLALDDFGAGFGSFQYLRHLPFSHLKIDGGFVRGLRSSRTDQLVVQALAGLVRGMGRETIAEFVGDRPTLELLRGYGVDYAQGFEVGRPLAALPATA